ncbi:MAG: GtrA family protein [Chitinophagaceae bacterium]|nr:MAG: GtrA family protein [Chitinophagaceae bacterium]
MLTFAKAQIASFLASMVDYLITILCVESLGFWYVVASSTGTIMGGMTNFSLGRNWVFRGGERERRIQLLRYFIVWTGYLLLATTGVYLLTHLGGINYIVSKITVTLFLAIAYNYPLQKRFVFR